MLKCFRKEETDKGSNHLKANANKNKFVEDTVKVEAQEYIKELNATINYDRAKHGKKPLKFDETPKKPDDEDDENCFDDDTPTKTIKKDPDSGFMYRDGKTQGFFYLDHRTAVPLFQSRCLFLFLSIFLLLQV